MGSNSWTWKPHYGLEEPLFYTTWFPEQSLSTAFISAGVARVGDLIDTNTVHQLIKEVSGRLERIVWNEMKSLKALFSTSLLTHIHSYITGDSVQMFFPELTTTEALDDNKTDQDLSNKYIPFSMATKDQLYNSIKNGLELKWRTERVSRHKRTHLPITPPQSQSWRVQTGDLQWRVLHPTMPTHTFLSTWNLTDSPDCKVCENHLFQVANIPTFISNNAQWFIFRWTIKSRRLEVSQTEKTSTLRANLKRSRIRLEYEFHAVNGNVEKKKKVKKKWCTYKGWFSIIKYKSLLTGK